MLVDSLHPFGESNSESQRRLDLGVALGGQVLHVLGQESSHSPGKSDRRGGRYLENAHAVAHVNS